MRFFEYYDDPSRAVTKRNLSTLHCRGADGPVVELDLACGLFDLNNQAAEQAAERSLTHGQVRTAEIRHFFWSSLR